MSQANLCRLCIKTCSAYKRLYDDLAVYEITVKYFDPEFLMKKNLTSICLSCWCQIVEFHNFKLSVLLAQTKLAEDEAMPEQVVIKCEMPEFRDDLLRDTSVNDDDDPISLSQLQDSESQLSALLEPGIASTSSKTGARKKLKTYGHRESGSAKARKSSQELQNRTAQRTTALNSEISEFQDEFLPASSIKVEKELQLVDVYSDSSDDEMSLLQPSTSRKSGGNDEPKNEASDDGSECSQTEIDSEHRMSWQRKSTQELDGLIAQWRPTLECLICCRPCASFSLLEGHYRQHHPNSEFYVLCCQTKFNTRHCIEEHIRLHNDPGIFRCKICGKTNSTKRNLSSHMAYWHSEMNREKLMCPECGKMSKTPGALRRHKQRHNAKREIKCTVCGLDFMDRKDFRDHMATHKRPDSYYCPDCPMTFRNRAGLRTHRHKEHPKPLPQVQPQTNTF